MSNLTPSIPPTSRLPVVDVPTPRLPIPDDCSGTCVCGVEPLAHPKYSFGMLLEARHLALEHQYHATRMNTHDIRLHDFGTVCGLLVKEHTAPECVDKYAILQPGIALDCCGREIVVPEPVFVPLFDGARNGWCGAPESILQLPSGMGLAETRPTLYVYLAYQQCDTDPIPSYVRACGCCENSCEHGNCVPSVTREGYQILVSSIKPTVWENPVGLAFCTWLDVQLKGPGMSPTGSELLLQKLDQILCAAVTAPCADFCAPDNNWLLLATLTFDSNNHLVLPIDNCTARRIVLSTGAIVEALECITATAIACCKTTDPFLMIEGIVEPNTANIANPGDASLKYTVTVTDVDATKTTSGFAIVLVPPTGITLKSATLTIDTSTGSTTSNPSIAADGSVSAPVKTLERLKSAHLVVNATFDPNKVSAGVANAAASIASYAGPHRPDVTIPITFTNVQVDGPHVMFHGLPRTLSAVQARSLFGPDQGLNITFDEVMNTANPAKLVTLNVGKIKTIVPAIVKWKDNQTLNIQAVQRQFLMALQKGGPILVTLAGGSKGQPPSASVLQSADGHSLDGTTPGKFTDRSGDGTQGGDFILSITITPGTN